jgi:hypothetical protein
MPLASFPPNEHIFDLLIYSTADAFNISIFCIFDLYHKNLPMTEKPQGEKPEPVRPQKKRNKKDCAEMQEFRIIKLR